MMFKKRTTTNDKEDFAEVHDHLHQIEDVLAMMKDSFIEAVNVLRDHDMRLQQIVMDSINERHRNDQVISQKFLDGNELMSKLSYHIQELSKETLQSIIYNSNIPMFERLTAFNEYIKIGGNGNCKVFAMKELILPDKVLWQSVVDTNYKPGEDDDNVFYQAVLRDTKRMLV